jgi:predicted NUDIX family NTP pyrophosphohydrolase
MYLDIDSGDSKRLEIPEIDRDSVFSAHDARTYIRPEQVPLLETLDSRLA